MYASVAPHLRGRSCLIPVIRTDGGEGRDGDGTDAAEHDGHFVWESE